MVRHPFIVNGLLSPRIAHSLWFHTLTDVHGTAPRPLCRVNDTIYAMLPQFLHHYLTRVMPPTAQTVTTYLMRILQYVAEAPCPATATYQEYHRAPAPHGEGAPFIHITAV